MIIKLYFLKNISKEKYENVAAAFGFAGDFWDWFSLSLISWLPNGQLRSEEVARFVILIG